MSIESEINQRSFRNQKLKGLINIMYTNNWVTNTIKSILERENITNQQFNILRILRGANEPLSTYQLRERMLDKMSDTSRIVDRLVIKKLVLKMVRKDDKRLVDIIISNEGRSLLAKLDDYNEEIDSIMDNLNDTELIELNTLLDKIREPKEEKRNESIH